MTEQSNLPNTIVSKTRANIYAWFSYVGKIPDDRGFYYFPTLPDFAD